MRFGAAVLWLAFCVVVGIGIGRWFLSLDTVTATDAPTTPEVVYHPPETGAAIVVSPNMGTTYFGGGYLLATQPFVNSR